MKIDKLEAREKHGDAPYEIYGAQHNILRFNSDNEPDKYNTYLIYEKINEIIDFINKIPTIYQLPLNTKIGDQVCIKPDENRGWIIK